MHARRYFVKAMDGGDARAAVAIDAYQALYGIEKDARDLSPNTSDHDTDLGAEAMSHISGGAGWWKSPCPDMARARGG